MYGGQWKQYGLLFRGKDIMEAYPGKKTIQLKPTSIDLQRSCSNPITQKEEIPTSRPRQV